jgi:hypothetical protein
MTLEELGVLSLGSDVYNFIHIQQKYKLLLEGDTSMAAYISIDGTGYWIPLSTLRHDRNKSLWLARWWFDKHVD